MAKIFILPLHAMGHLNGLIGLGKQLEAVGHDCWHLAPVNYESHYESYGAKFLPAFKNGKEAMAELQTLKRPETILKFRQAYSDLVCEQLEELDLLIEVYKPDVWLVDGLVAQYSFPALNRGIPCALVHTMLPMFNDGAPPPNTTNKPAPRFSWIHVKNLYGWYRLTKRTRASLAYTGERQIYEMMAKKYCIPTKSLNFDCPMCFDMNIPKFVLCSKALDVPRQPNPNLHYVGPSLAPEQKTFDFPWEKLCDRKKLIYCSFGTMNVSKYAKDLVNNLIEFVRHREDLQLVIAENRGLTPDAKMLPNNVVKVDFAPQRAMLQKADLFVTHGGLNSIKESIVAKVPMIVFPTGNDQPGNAMRVDLHGLGLCGDRRSIEPKQLSKIIEKVLGDTQILKNITFMSQIFETEMAQNLPSIQINELLRRV